MQAINFSLEENENGLSLTIEVLRRPTPETVEYLVNHDIGFFGHKVYPMAEATDWIYHYIDGFIDGVNALAKYRKTSLAYAKTMVPVTVKSCGSFGKVLTTRHVLLSQDEFLKFLKTALKYTPASNAVIRKASKGICLMDTDFTRYYNMHKRNSLLADNLP